MIQTDVTTHAKSVTVTTYAIKTAQVYLWHCMICTCPLYQTSSLPRIIIPGNANNNEHDKAIIKFPYFLKCKGRSPKYGKCFMTYAIEGMVDMV